LKKEEEEMASICTLPNHTTQFYGRKKKPKLDSQLRSCNIKNDPHDRFCISRILTNFGSFVVLLNVFCFVEF
jgi:hypothetical protein